MLVKTACDNQGPHLFPARRAFPEPLVFIPFASEHSFLTKSRSLCTSEVRGDERMLRHFLKQSTIVSDSNTSIHTASWGPLKEKKKTYCQIEMEALPLNVMLFLLNDKVKTTEINELVNKSKRPYIFRILMRLSWVCHWNCCPQPPNDIKASDIKVITHLNIKRKNRGAGQKRISKKKPHFSAKLWKSQTGTSSSGPTIKVPLLRKCASSFLWYGRDLLL